MRKKRKKRVHPYYMIPVYGYGFYGDGGDMGGGDGGGGGMEEAVRKVVRDLVLEALDAPMMRSEMTKVGSAESQYGLYDLYVGYGEKNEGKFHSIYNVVRNGDPKPEGGYFDPSPILSLKKLPTNSFEVI